MKALLRNVRVMSAGFAALLTIASSPAYSHHSRSNFDQSQKLVLTGEVTEFSWTNPHIFVEVITDDGSVWLVESFSVTGMRRRGWEADSLKPGDKVIVNVAPDKDKSKTFASLNTITFADGSPVADLGMSKPAKKIIPSEDFSGIWATDLEFLDGQGVGPPPKDWPYTPEGLRQAQAYDPSDSPENQCLELGVPRMMIYPYSIELTRTNDSLVMFKEHLNETRTIWLDQKAARSAKEDAPSPAGTSVAKMVSDNELHVVTDNFAPTHWGIENALDSSRQKGVEEVYKLSDDGLKLHVTFTIADPVVFTEPVVREILLHKGVEREFARVPCDKRAADRHMTLAVTGKQANAVPTAVKKSWLQRLINRN